MANPGTFEIDVTLTGLASGDLRLRFQSFPANALTNVTMHDLVAGVNTLGLPTGLTWTLIVPPAGNTTSFAIGGFAFNPGRPLVLGADFANQPVYTIITAAPIAQPLILVI